MSALSTGRVGWAGVAGDVAAMVGGVHAVDDHDAFAGRVAHLQATRPGALTGVLRRHGLDDPAAGLVALWVVEAAALYRMVAPSLAGLTEPAVAGDGHPGAPVGDGGLVVAPDLADALPGWFVALAADAAGRAGQGALTVWPGVVPRALGQYHPGAGLIVVDPGAPDVVSVACHELGHALDADRGGDLVGDELFADAFAAAAVAARPSTFAAAAPLLDAAATRRRTRCRPVHPCLPAPGVASLLAFQALDVTPRPRCGHP